MTGRRALAASIAVLVLGGCGGEERKPAQPVAAKKPVAREDQPACAVFHASDVAAVVKRTTGRELDEIGEVATEKMESEETSACGYFAGPNDDVAVKVTIDGALNPAKRYWYRVTELNQRSDNWDGPDPRLVKGVGQDKSYGGAGAFWVPSMSKLTAYRDEKMLTVIFFVPGVSDRESSAAAASLARTVYRRLFGDRPPAPPKSLQDRKPHP